METKNNAFRAIGGEGIAPTIKRSRKRKELTLRFRVRPCYAGQDRAVALQIRLTVNGDRTGDYSSGIMVPADKWNQATQRVNGRSSLILEINERIGEVELQHREILRELKRLHAKGQGMRPTAELVKCEFVQPGSATPTLLVWYTRYLDFLDSMHGTQDAQAEKTITRAYKTRDHLRAFHDMVNRNSKDSTPVLGDVTTGWGKRFYTWLQLDPATGKHRMQKDSASKYLAHVRDAVSYAVDEGYLSLNPLDRFRPKRGKGKEVYFLEPDHLDRLMGLQLKGDIGVTVWWAKLMCLTGLDYKDAVLYARDRPKYDRQSETGKPKIVITRSKPPLNVCEIFRLPELDALFAEYPTGPADYTLADLNRNLKVIAEAIDFPAETPFTSKICRKTAGAHFLRMGFLVSTVSKMLGHSSIRTTEDHYVKVRASHVDQDIERVARFTEVRPISPVFQSNIFRRAS